MNNDTLTRARARAVLGRLRVGADGTEAEDYALHAEASGPLLRLAEACARRAEAEGAARWAKQALAPMGYDDPRIDAAIRRRDRAVSSAALIVPVADEAIDAALAELAALDGGEVGR